MSNSEKATTWPGRPAKTVEKATNKPLETTQQKGRLVRPQTNQAYNISCLIYLNGTPFKPSSYTPVLHQDTPKPHANLFLRLGKELKVRVDGTNT